MDDMLLRYTDHARARMTDRGVSQEQVESVVRRPWRSLPAQQGREEVQGLFEREGRSMLLRVILERGEVVSVITVIATSRLAKYGVELP
jgi:hypothetical protein